MPKPTDNQNIRENILEICIARQLHIVDTARQAMLEAQSTANDQPGTMGDKYESFREQMQIDRDMYAKRYDEGLQILATLQKIDVNKKTFTAPALGAIVRTDSAVFFISVSLGQIQFNDAIYQAISMQSPLFMAMAGKKQNEGFMFRDKNYHILSIE